MYTHSSPGNECKPAQMTHGFDLDCYPPGAPLYSQCSDFAWTYGYALRGLPLEQRRIRIETRANGSRGKQNALCVSKRRPPMATGTVKFFNSQKGFGFIVQDGGGPDVFVHISAVERAGMSNLNEGQKLSFDIEADRKNGKSAAANLQAV